MSCSLLNCILTSYCYDQLKHRRDYSETSAKTVPRNSSEQCKFNRREQKHLQQPQMHWRMEKKTKCNRTISKDFEPWVNPFFYYCNVTLGITFDSIPKNFHPGKWNRFFVIQFDFIAHSFFPPLWPFISFNFSL